MEQSFTFWNIGVRVYDLTAHGHRFHATTPSIVNCTGFVNSFQRLGLRVQYGFHGGLYTRLRGAFFGRFNIKRYGHSLYNYRARHGGIFVPTSGTWHVPVQRVHRLSSLVSKGRGHIVHVTVFSVSSL